VVATFFEVFALTSFLGAKTTFQHSGSSELAWFDRKHKTSY